MDLPVHTYPGWYNSCQTLSKKEKQVISTEYVQWLQHTLTQTEYSGCHTLTQTEYSSCHTPGQPEEGADSHHYPDNEHVKVVATSFLNKGIDR